MFHMKCYSNHNINSPLFHMFQLYFLAGPTCLFMFCRYFPHRLHLYQPSFWYSSSFSWNWTGSVLPGRDNKIMESCSSI